MNRKDTGTENVHDTRDESCSYISICDVIL